MRVSFSELSTINRAANYVAKSSYYCESARVWLNAAFLGLAVIVVSACSDNSSDTSAAAEVVAKDGNTSSVDDSNEVTGQAVSPLKQAGDQAGDGSGLTVLVFGDSISAAYGIKRDDGWVALLQERLAPLYPDARVVNASVSGETTQGGRARLKAALERHSPDLVFLELGGNDALRGYPINQLRDNLTTMVSEAQTIGAKVVLLGMQIPPNYGPQYTREFAQTFQTVAEEKQAHLVPFFLEGVALVEGMIQSDGIHPTTKAQPLLVETGWQALVAAMSEQYPLLN